MVLILPKIFE
jgi:hypothetical protein